MNLQNEVIELNGIIYAIVDNHIKVLDLFICDNWMELGLENVDAITTFNNEIYIIMDKKVYHMDKIYKLTLLPYYKPLVSFYLNNEKLTALDELGNEVEFDFLKDHWHLKEGACLIRWSFTKRDLVPVKKNKNTTMIKYFQVDFTYVPFENKIEVLITENFIEGEVEPTSVGTKADTSNFVNKLDNVFERIIESNKKEEPEPIKETIDSYIEINNIFYNVGGFFKPLTDEVSNKEKDISGLIQI